MFQQRQPFFTSSRHVNRPTIPPKAKHELLLNTPCTLQSLTGIIHFFLMDYIYCYYNVYLRIYNSHLKKKKNSTQSIFCIEMLHGFSHSHSPVEPGCIFPQLHVDFPSIYPLSISIARNKEGQILTAISFSLD